MQAVTKQQAGTEYKDVFATAGMRAGNVTIQPTEASSSNRRG